LRAVACPTRSTCFAVGEFVTRGRGYYALIERWDGTVWSLAPGRGKAVGKLEAIACRSAVDCVTVGGWVNTIAERYDGTSWSIVPVGISTSGVSLGQ
jgi:hypothetical protein